MAITVTITKPQVFDEYGRLLAVGTNYTPYNDDYARNLVQTQRATDTNGVMTNPQPYEFGGVFDSAGNLIGLESRAGAAAFGATPLTWANRPVLSSTQRGGFYATDVGSGNLFNWDGSRFKAVNGSVLLDSIDTANSSTTATTQQNLNPNHRLIPAGVIGANDRLRIWLGASKNGTTAAITLRVHFGPLGTISDPVIATILDLATTNVSYGTLMEFKRISATQLQKQGNGNPGDSYGGANATAYPAAVTVSSMDTTGMYLSISSQADVSGEIVTLQDYTLELYSTDS